MNRPIIVIHGPDHALAALAAAEAMEVPVTLRSAPGASGALGAQVFQEMVAAAAACHPKACFEAVLDCADAPGDALNALRHGIESLRLKAPADVMARVCGMAAQTGATIQAPGGGEALVDLAYSLNPPAACRAFLGKAI